MKDDVSPTGRDSGAIDFTKPVQTRDGRKVRILCTDAVDTAGFCVIGLVHCDDGTEQIECWTREGRLYIGGSSVRDLVQVKQKGWVNIYPLPLSHDRFAAECSYLYKTREQADAGAKKGRIACVEVEF